LDAGFDRREGQIVHPLLVDGGLLFC